MLVAALIMIVGIAAVAALSHWRGYRLGGVMVVPLLAVYTFREPLSPLIFVVGTAVAWGTLWAVRDYTLNHGRRVFLIAVLSGICATVLAAYLLAFHTPARLPFDDAEVVASIFPGVAAYNIMRLDSESRLADIGLMVALFGVLMGLGIAGLFALRGVRPPTPAVLALPTSDLVVWLGIEPDGDALTRLTPQWLSVTLLAVDVLVYEAVRKRYDLRLVGIVVIPLLAMFSLRLQGAAVLFAVGVAAVFVVLTVLHWLTLLYGRVLLSLALVLGTVYALAIGVTVSDGAPGLTVFFLGLFVGIAGYNIYYVSPKCRAASVRLSAGLFVAFHAAVIAVVGTPMTGLFAHEDPLSLLLGAVVVGFAIREVYRLERSRPPLENFASASVFADIDADDSDGVTSPLVSTGQQTTRRPGTDHNTGDD